MINYRFQIEKNSIDGKIISKNFIKTSKLLITLNNVNRNTKLYVSLNLL